MDSASSACAAERSWLPLANAQRLLVSSERATPFSRLFPHRRAGNSDGKSSRELLVVPQYERLTDRALPLTCHAPSVYLLRNPKPSRVYKHSVFTISMEVKIRVPEDMVAHIAPLPPNCGPLRVRSSTITASDDHPLGLTVANISGKMEEIPSGTALATVSFIRLSLDVAVREVHPLGNRPYWSMEERIWAERRSIRVAQDEAQLLGFKSEEGASWPARSDRIMTTSGYASEASPAQSTPTSPMESPAVLKQENFPWNYSWGKGYSVI